jgi:hypothetical protein
MGLIYNQHKLKYKYTTRGKRCKDHKNMSEKGTSQPKEKAYQGKKGDRKPWAKRGQASNHRQKVKIQKKFLYCTMVQTIASPSLRRDC